MATLTSGSASSVIDQLVATLAFDEFIQAAPVMPALYDQRGSSKQQETDASISGLGQFAEKTELAEPDEDNPIQQFEKKFLHKEYALQAKIERKVINDQRFDFFGKFGSKIGQSAMRTVETLAAGPFNGAFTSATYTAEDGKSLCNSAHTNVDSGNSQSNTGTTALSFASVGTTRVSMRDWTDYRGQQIVTNADALLVPTALEQTAFEIVRSSGDPDSANLKANFHNGRYAVIVWDYLTDANNWFMLDSRAMKMHLRWYWRIVLEIFGDGDLFKGLRRLGGYFRSSHGVSDWRWIFGHNVT